MSSKQLMRLAVVLAVLVVAWLALALVRRPASDRTEALALPTVDTAAVDSVALSTARGPTNLVRGADKKWRANGYPADSTVVHGLLRGLADTARSSELVAESTTSFGRLGLGPDSVQRIVVYSHGRPVFDVSAGKRTSDYSGVYLRRGNDNQVYAVRGQLADAVTHRDDDWRDKHVVSMVPDSAATIGVTRGTRTYMLSRLRTSKGAGAPAGATWVFASGQAADSSAVASLLGNFRDIEAAGFATRTQADSLDFKRPRARTRILSRSGGVLANLLFDSTAAGTWTRADSGAVVFRLDPWLWGHLAPAESTLMAKKPATRAAKKPTTKKTKK